MWGHVTQFWNFGPPISLERLKLETSNFSSRWMAVSSSEKKFKIGSKGRVMWGSRDPILEFWDEPNISRTVEARKFKFGTKTDSGDFER